jgi:translation initiation factor 2 beta subunit (eIF-2beta)/eIF-5
MSVQVCPDCGESKPINDGEGRTYYVTCQTCIRRKKDPLKVGFT